MWVEILQVLGGLYNAYRAAQDAGVWFAQIDAPIFQNYMESSMIAKGRL